MAVATLGERRRNLARRLGESIFGVSDERESLGPTSARRPPRFGWYRAEMVDALDGQRDVPRASCVGLLPSIQIPRTSRRVRFLTWLGFKALATTSSGFAWSLGRKDNGVPLLTRLSSTWRRSRGCGRCAGRCRLRGRLSRSTPMVSRRTRARCRDPDRGALDRGARRVTPAMRLRIRPRRRAGSGQRAAMDGGGQRGRPDRAVRRDHRRPAGPCRTIRRLVASPKPVRMAYSPRGCVRCRTSSAIVRAVVPRPSTSLFGRTSRRSPGWPRSACVGTRRRRSVGRLGVGRVHPSGDRDRRAGNVGGLAEGATSAAIEAGFAKK